MTSLTPSVHTVEQFAETGLHSCTRTPQNLDVITYEYLQHYLTFRCKKRTVANAASQEAMRSTLAKIIDDKMALILIRIAAFIDLQVGELVWEVEFKLCNLSFRSTEPQSTRIDIIGSDML